MITTRRLLMKRLLSALLAFTTCGVASAQAPAGETAAPPNQKQRTAQTKENYRAVTEADGLSCKFSQDITTSMGIAISGLADSPYINPGPAKSTTQSAPFTGTMWSTANHFKCTEKTGMEREIELINKVPHLNADIKNGKLVIRTRDFGTVYRNEGGGAFEMTESQIKRLKTSLGF